tara:strand:+ start:3549 stop:3908 length:360 start_codon:yes stop_codon:yes gene_type:complete
MPVKIYSSGQHIFNTNGVDLKNIGYEFFVNPNGNNKVHVSLANDGLAIKKEYDSLENFFNHINKSQEPLLTKMQNDLIKFKAMPQILYKHNFTQKANKDKKHKKKQSRKKIKKRKSIKK